MRSAAAEARSPSGRGEEKPAALSVASLRDVAVCQHWRRVRGRRNFKSRRDTRSGRPTTNPVPALCYIVSMKKVRRAGATETFSVSVDPRTRQALRALANRDFGGNLSALVTDLAEEARRRMAADAYLRRHRISPPSTTEADAIEREIGRELAAWKKRPKKRKVA